MSALWCGRFPVSEHLRPRQRRLVRTSADVDPRVLAAYPDVVAELNLCFADVFVGPGRPGPGWDNWTTSEVPLDEALALPVGGEA